MKIDTKYIFIVIYNHFCDNQKHFLDKQMKLIFQCQIEKIHNKSENKAKITKKTINPHILPDESKKTQLFTLKIQLFQLLLSISRQIATKIPTQHLHLTEKHR